MSDQIKDIMKLISSPKVKCVSFDMFDTLVQRPVMNPEDVFVLVGNILGESPFFCKRRIAAQNRALLLKDYYDAYITLDDIYEQYKIMYACSTEDIETIKKTELDVEYQLSFPRHRIKMLYDYARTKGKQVIICSDMYLSSQFLESILQKNGYEGWMKLYVSCEQNATKRSGELYDIVISDMRDMGIRASEILHIGDNMKSDIETAQKREIQTVFIPSAMARFNECSRLKTIENWNSKVYLGSQNLLVGLYAGIVFDDPFEPFDKTTRYNGDYNKLGKFLAPFFISFCIWLLEEIHKDNIDLLALVWRDGYLPLEIMNLICKEAGDELPTVQKTYLNRALRYGYVAEHQGGFFDSLYQWALNPEMNLNEFNNTIMQCIDDDDRRKVFEIFAEHGYTSTYDKLGTVDKYNWFAHELEDIFRKNHADSNYLLKEHIQPMVDSKKLGVFDIGYRGTVSRFLHDFFSVNSVSYHMLGTMGCEDCLEGVLLKTYVKYGQNIVLNTKNTLHKFLELIISEQSPGILRLKRQENKIAFDYDPFFNEDSNVEEIQKGILEYAILFAHLLAPYKKYLNIDRNVLFTMVTSILSSPSEKDAKCIKNLNVTATHYASAQDDFARWYDSFFGE